MDVRNAIDGAARALVTSLASAGFPAAPFLAICEALTADLEAAHPQSATRLKASHGFGRVVVRQKVRVLGGPLSGVEVEFPLTREVAVPLEPARHHHVVAGARPATGLHLPPEAARHLQAYLDALAARRDEVEPMRLSAHRRWPEGLPGPSPSDLAAAFPDLAIHLPREVLAVS